MENIKNWYNQNRKKIFLGLIFIIVIVFIIFQLGRGIRSNTESSATNQVSDINTNTLNSIAMSSNKSVITNETITTTQKEITAVDDFISFCNSGKIQEAYNLISDECKEEMYPSIKDFQKGYYNKNFNGKKKNVKIENWTGNVYKVDINEDALATGRYNSEDTVVDYITIVNDSNNEPKININGYIKREEINKTESSNGIDIKIIQKDTYMDYEYYTFEIKNQTNKGATLGTQKDFETIYLEDKNGVKYEAYMYELLQDELQINGRETKTLKIKYFNLYSSSKEIESLVFSDIKLRGYNNSITIKFDL